MLNKCRVLCTLLAVGLLAVGTASADVIVGFDPTPAMIDSVGGVVNVDLVAAIPEGEAIVGWGLDVTFADPSIAQIVNVAVDPAFDPAPAPDGDGLAGLAFPGSVFGEVVLATITFQGLAIGETDLFASITDGDLTEGFAIDPSLGGGFANVVFNNGHLIVPEPASIALLALGFLALRRR